MPYNSLNSPPSTAPVVDRTLDRVVRSWIMNDGSREIYSYEPETLPENAMEHVETTRPTGEMELYTLRGNTSFLLSCSSDNQSAYTLISSTEDTGVHLQTDRRLAWYFIVNTASSQNLRIFTPAPYTGELIDAMNHYIQLITKDANHDRWLVSQLAYHTGTLKIAREVSDCFFAKAKAVMPKGRLSWRANMLAEKATSVLERLKSGQYPFWQSDDHLNPRAIRFLAVAINNSDLFGRQESLQANFDIEGTIEVILTHICASYEKIDPLEKVELRFWY
jgi:hypothetical protein